MEPKYKRILIKLSGEALAGDLPDGDGLARLRHCQRHHNIPLPFSYCLWAADAPEGLDSRNYQHR